MCVYCTSCVQVALAFGAILAKKQEINTFQDQSKKKFTVNTKDNFWPVIIVCITEFDWKI